MKSIKNCAASYRCTALRFLRNWIPAFAGMTGKGWYVAAILCFIVGWVCFQSGHSVLGVAWWLGLIGCLVMCDDGTTEDTEIYTNSTDKYNE